MRPSASSVVGSMICALAQLAFEVGDAAFDEALFFLGGVIFGVFPTGRPVRAPRRSPESRRDARRFSDVAIRRAILGAHHSKREFFHDLPFQSVQTLMQFLQGIHLELVAMLHAHAGSTRTGQRGEIDHPACQCLGAEWRRNPSPLSCLQPRLTMKSMSPFLIMSTICGRPSLTLLTTATGMPAASIVCAVPRVRPD